MVFSSTIFLCVFLPLVLLLYYLLPGSVLKNAILLLSSLFFYAWGEPKYIILMVISILGNYLFGLSIHHSHNQGRKGRIALVLSVLFNLGLLFYFKYSLYSVLNICPISAIINTWLSMASANM